MMIVLVNTKLLTSPTIEDHNLYDGARSGYRDMGSYEVELVMLQVMLAMLAMPESMISLFIFRICRDASQISEHSAG